MADDFCERLHSCYKKKTKVRNDGNALLLGFFALSSLFSMLAFFIALIALIK